MTLANKSILFLFLFLFHQHHQHHHSFYLLIFPSLSLLLNCRLYSRNLPTYSLPRSLWLLSMSNGHRPWSFQYLPLWPTLVHCLSTIFLQRPKECCQRCDCNVLQYAGAAHRHTIIHPVLPARPISIRVYEWVAPRQHMEAILYPLLNYMVRRSLRA